jgi:hypothetical protein
VQRSLMEGEAMANNGDKKEDGGSVDGEDESGDYSEEKVKEEVDALLENLLVARRELMGHQLDGEVDVDYAKLIQGADNNDDESSDDEGSNISNDNNNLSSTLQSEYNALKTHWQSTLNKHHANLALHSGMSTNTSKFQSKAVDLSFWEQVKGSLEHDRFKSGGSGGNELSSFDDSKLYQQMLKDFISASGSSATTNNSNSKKNKGMGMDPAQEAAERLKRAMRKKSGGNVGDVELTTLLTPGMNDGGGGMLLSTGASNSGGKKSSVDRRASKGRKIRYVVHPKLVNFTFPVGRAEPMIPEDVWFKSLFGGVGSSR